MIRQVFLCLEVVDFLMSYFESVLLLLFYVVQEVSEQDVPDGHSEPKSASWSPVGKLIFTFIQEDFL
jgi:hypothetical protein